MSDPSQNGGGSWYGRAFGIELEAAVPIPGVTESAGPQAMRSASMELLATEALDRTWRASEAEPMLTRRFHNGRLMMTIDRHEQLGYKVWAPHHGRYVISTDGRVIRSALPRTASLRWQRLFFAQVLPLAATLQGYHLLHASAVALDGSALAFVASSGTGKTSIAAHLVARGASFVTDDVLALEERPDGVFAHPGAAMASLDESEYTSMSTPERERVGRVRTRADKLLCEITLVDRPVPLRALYFLERQEVDRLRIEEIVPPDPGRLLGGGFISYLGTREHLVRHLEMCARLAASVPAFTVALSPSVSARAAAEALANHVSGLKPTA